MQLEIKTLTPLWTGGVNAGKVDRIHETGILGSLRWWYEAIVRGLGGKACDPSQAECRFDAEKYAKSKADDERQRLRDGGLCDVCQVFGATGWRRRFRLAIEERNISDALIQHTVRLKDRAYTDYKGQTRIPTWYFRDPTQSRPVPNTPKIGVLTLHIQSLARDFHAEVIAGLLQFIADWAALGARPQMGLGVVELVDGRIDTNPLYGWLSALAGSETYPTLPSLRNVFFVRITHKNGSFSEQDTFNLKYDLRRLFATDKRLRHFIMGTTEDGRMAAKIKISRPYEHERESTIRVWGWVPEEANEYQRGWDRDKVLEKIHNHFNTKYRLQVWREIDSPRDTVMPNTGDALVFLRSLLAIEEGDDAA